MSATTVRLWLFRETDKARQYCKHDRDMIGPNDLIWVPLSIIEHTTKRGREHCVQLPDWFIEKEGL